MNFIIFVQLLTKSSPSTNSKSSSSLLLNLPLTEGESVIEFISKVDLDISSVPAKVLKLFFLK